MRIHLKVTFKEIKYIYTQICVCVRVCIHLFIYMYFYPLNVMYVFFPLGVHSPTRAHTNTFIRLMLTNCNLLFFPFSSFPCRLQTANIGIVVRLSTPLMNKNRSFWKYPTCELHKQLILFAITFNEIILFEKIIILNVFCVFLFLH